MIPDAVVERSLTNILTYVPDVDVLEDYGVLGDPDCDGERAWLFFGQALQSIGLDLRQVRDILVDCFSHGEDIEREFADLLDDVWIRTRKRLEPPK